MHCALPCGGERNGTGGRVRSGQGRTTCGRVPCSGRIIPQESKRCVHVANRCAALSPILWHTLQRRNRQFVPAALHQTQHSTDSSHDYAPALDKKYAYIWRNRSLGAAARLVHDGKSCHHLASDHTGSDVRWIKKLYRVPRCRDQWIP